LQNSNKIVHSLWIGQFLSNVEILTLKSFVANGHDFYLWTYQELETSLPEGVIVKDANIIIPLERVFRYRNRNQFGHGKGSFGGFSDIFRYKLLFDHGGWWVDMDVTCLKPFDFEEEYVFRKHHELKLVGNMMKCPKGSELMMLCYEKAVAEVDENNRDWNKPINILNEFVIKLGLESYIKDFSNQDVWPDILQMLLKRKEVLPTWKAIHWANEEWRRNKLDKNYYIQKSLFGEYMNMYGLKSNNFSSFKSKMYYFKLNKFYNKFIYLPVKFLYTIKWHLNSGSKEQP
jgi:hypothetical protein